MIDYIATLLPRIQQFSKGLNDTAIFADIPWGFVDDDGDKVTYIFRRNNELLVSKKGDVTTGHWEYLPVMQSLLIEHAGRKRMYNQGFVDNVVMALRKDGTEELFLLANQQVLADLNTVGYLERKAKVEVAAQTETFTKLDRHDLIEVELKNPQRYILIRVSKDEAIFAVGNEVLDIETRKELEDGLFWTTTGYKIVVEKGRLIEVTSSSIMDILFWFLVIVIAVIIIAYSL